MTGGELSLVCDQVAIVSTRMYYGCGECACVCVCVRVRACTSMSAQGPSRFLLVLGIDLEYPVSNGRYQVSEREVTCPQSHSKIGVEAGVELMWSCGSEASRTSE